VGYLIEEEFTRTVVLGFGKLLVLWLLYIRARSGYELMSEVERLTGMAFGPGLIYPFLHTLEKGDYIAGRWIERAGRKVKYYSMTRKGKALLRKARDLFKLPIKEVLLDLLEREKEGS
jgi:DNA-binding PadR family transcriptional regulator